MRGTDLVTIIMPTYNSSDFILNSVQNVISQTYENFELLIVDDCSTDNTVEILNDIKDERITIIVLNENSGAAVARNTALKIAKGKYIAFLDSDDMWDERKLEIQIDFMKENKYSFSYTTYNFVDDGNNVISGNSDFLDRTTYDILKIRTIIATSTVVIKAELIEDVMIPNRRTGQDYAFWLLLLRKVDAYGINKPLTHLLRRKNSLSKNKLQNIKDIWEIQRDQENMSKVVICSHIITYIFFVFIRKIKMLKK